MKLKALLITALLFLCYSTCIGQTKRGYAVYTAEDKTITCYDDGKMSSRPGTEKLELVDRDDNLCGIDRFDENIKEVVEKVKFDPSFISAKFRSITRWFSSMSALTTIEGLQYFDTSEVTSARVVFNGCSSLETIDLSSLSMPKLQDAYGMFLNCGAKTIKLFQSGNQITSTERMFMECKSLESLDLNNLNTSNVTTMENMFSDCPNLASIDLSSFDTGNVKNMATMFLGCEALTKLEVNYFDTHNVTQMNGMFAKCKSLINIGESNVNTNTFNYISFDTGNVTNMKSMFADCSSLQRLDLSDFDTSNVTDMTSMFAGCSSLESNFFKIVGFNTSKVTNMERMFYGCQSLISLSLYTFDTSKVTNMSEMFNICELLMTILVGDGWTVENVTQSSLMFGACRNLKGSQGTVWAYNKVEANYAHVDGGDSNPGFLTFRAFGTFPLWIGGVQVTELNYNNIPVNEGKATYSNKNKTLTLNNATINCGNEIGIRNGTSSTNCIDGLYIKILGTCTINSESNPMSLYGNTTIQDLYSYMSSTLVMSGKNSINIMGIGLTFNNKETFLTMSSGYLFNGVLSASLTFGNDVTFCGTCSGKAVNNVASVTLGSGTNYVYPEDGHTITFNSSQKTLYIDDNQLTDGLLIGQNYPIWLNDIHLNSAYMLSIKQTPLFYAFMPIDIYKESTGLSLDSYVIKGMIPNSSPTIRSTATFLTIEMTGDWNLSTTESNKAALDLQGQGKCTIWGTGTLHITSENGPAITSDGVMLYVNDVDIDVSGKSGAFTNLNNLYFINVAGTATCERGYVVSNTSYFSTTDCYITNNVSFDSRNKQIASKSLVLAREHSITTGLNEAAPQIDNGELKNDNASDAWYTIDGRKLSGKPTKKGIYIHNGRISLTN